MKQEALFPDPDFLSLAHEVSATPEDRERIPLQIIRCKMPRTYTPLELFGVYFIYREGGFLITMN